MNIEFRVASESSVILYFGSTIDPLIAKEVQKAYQSLKKAKIEGFFEIIPSYASLLVSFDVLRYDYDAVCAQIENIISHADHADEAVQSIVTIPVYYGLDVGLDLEILAEEKNLQVQEVIDLHVKELYSVYAIGFAPGFAYMGQIDARLATSDRKSVV